MENNLPMVLLLDHPSFTEEEHAKITQAWKDKKIQIIEDKYSVPDAVERISIALKEDEGYYYGWQANIAMAFKDLFQYNVLTEKENIPVAVYKEREIDELANKAAKNFLNLLIKE